MRLTLLGLVTVVLVWLGIKTISTNVGLSEDILPNWEGSERRRMMIKADSDQKDTLGM